ncbi:nucleotide exchange factor GrpE [Candidatus Woesearchaeota archaeon CG10_big_fil_rev_8_21_14_0_10_37_12]|nr:MAG: nucleotide exchange factor GrpE [Candidatus Woesearchaeota archaeon CG10_big_fil_rev_8_21_14_0_10_37_12]
MSEKKTHDNKTKEKEVPEIERLKLQIAERETKIQDYTNHLKRLQAEFENYCKRVEKERKEFMGLATERVIVRLLLIIDDFERALQQLNDLPEQTSKGVEMIFKNLHKVLDEEQVMPIKSVGEKFDPYKHEVLLQVESEEPENIILEELQKGYTMNGKVIRYAKVKVSKGKQEEVTQND